MDKKYLIIHMDDMGSSHAANTAGIELFEKGIVTSCSVMVPCPYAYDFIRWWTNNKEYDTGVHLTLASEWDNGKWRPVGQYDQTASLWSPLHFMWQTNDEVMQNAKSKDVHRELEAQTQLALKWGLEPSHFDLHMHTVKLVEGSYEDYLMLAAKYNIPPTVPIDWSISVGGEPGMTLEKKFEYCHDTLRNLKPGISLLTLHPVIDTPEARYIIPDWYDRNCEYKMFMSDETHKVIVENDIELICYRKLKDNTK
ncbi:MAG: polysaccharide deacetylase family protein [Defluviitaleaceae bacterium]|nr:polysaccharide deacetylase family protein [Defluviitaleaceae bacterium]